MIVKRSRHSCLVFSKKENGREEAPSIWGHKTPGSVFEFHAKIRIRGMMRFISVSYYPSTCHFYNKSRYYRVCYRPRRYGWCRSNLWPWPGSWKRRKSRSAFLSGSNRLGPAVRKKIIPVPRKILPGASFEPPFCLVSKDEFEFFDKPFA